MSKLLYAAVTVVCSQQNKMQNSNSNNQMQDCCTFSSQQYRCVRVIWRLNFPRNTAWVSVLFRKVSAQFVNFGWNPVNASRQLTNHLLQERPWRTGLCRTPQTMNEQQLSGEVAGFKQPCHLTEDLAVDSHIWNMMSICNYAVCQFCMMFKSISQPQDH